MRPLPFPVNLSGDPVGELRVDEIRLVALLGLPHMTSSDSAQFPGPVSLWAFEFDDGAPVVIELHPLMRVAYVVCDVAKLDSAIAALGLPGALVSWRADSAPTPPGNRPA